MNTESNYVNEKPTEEQGLGRMPTQPTMLRPVLDEPMPRNSDRETRPRIRPRPIPKPVLLPRPVIDKNPVPAPPKLKINTVKKTSTQKSQPTTKSTSKQPNSQQDILAGSFSIGGMQVKKTHAAMAGGGIAGGLLLWKILF